MRFGTLRPVLRVVLFGSTLLMGSGFGAELTTTPPANYRSVATQQFLTEKLALWQKRLQLENWRVTLITSERAKLRAGTLGNINWDFESKSAVIHVLDASGYDLPLHETMQAMEVTLVHELIHLEFCASTRPDPASRAEEEIAVNHVTEALIQLDRRKQ